jgi:hypothetical protein
VGTEAAQAHRLASVNSTLLTDDPWAFGSLPDSDGAAASATTGQDTHLSHRSRLFTAAVNFFLTAYAAVTLAAMKMLRCVWVPGTPQDHRALFIQASVTCAYRGWQVRNLKKCGGVHLPCPPTFTKQSQ